MDSNQPYVGCSNASACLLPTPRGACFNQPRSVTKITSLPSDDWRVEMLRLTAFPTAGESSAVAKTCWSVLFGVPYETATEDVRKGITQLRGRIDDALMVVTRNPVTLELRQLAGDPAEPLTLDALSPYSQAVPPFVRYAMRWFVSVDCPNLRRLAFGAILLKPVPSQKSGYEMLNGYLPSVTVDPESCDLLYQINRRRPSAVVDGLRLNRLSQWSMQQARSLTVSSDGAIAHGLEEFACRVELDINSVSSLDPLPADGLSHLFKELEMLASEIARDGDIV